MCVTTGDIKPCYSGSDHSHIHMVPLLTTWSNSFPIRKRLYPCSGSFRDFIVDTGSTKHIISVGTFESLNSNAIIKPTGVSTSSIIGHKLPILGCCNFPTGDDKSSAITCGFLITDHGLFILGLEYLIRHQGQLSSLTTEGSSGGV